VRIKDIDKQIANATLIIQEHLTPRRRRV